MTNEESLIARPNAPAANAPTANAPDGDSSVVDLLRRLTEQGSHLAQQQVALVQAEVRESVNDAKASVGAFAGATILGISSIGVLLMGIAYLLDARTDLELWAATLIVGAVTALLAFILYRSAMAKAEHASLAASRTRRTLERTPDAATGNL
jgi:Putative Actinobacterial Holin-X, holin superfamily III